MATKVQLSTLETHLRDTVSKHVSERVSANQEFIQKEEALEKAMREADRRFHLLEEQCAQLCSELATAKANLDSTQDMLEKRTMELHTTRIALQDTESKLDATEAVLREERATVAALEQRITHLEDLIRATQNAADQRAAELAEAHASLAEKTQCISEKTTATELLQRQIGERDESLAVARQTLSELHSKNEDLTRLIEERDEQVTQLEERHAEKEQLLQNTEEEHNQSLRLLQAEMAETIEKAARMDHLQAEQIASLTQQIAVCNAQHAANIEQLKNWKEEASQHQQTVRTLCEERDSALRKFEEAREQFQEKINEAERVNKSLSAAVTELQIKAEAAEQAIAAGKRSLLAAEADKEVALANLARGHAAEIEALSKKGSRLETQLREKECAVQQLKRDVEQQNAANRAGVIEDRQENKVLQAGELSQRKRLQRLDELIGALKTGPPATDAGAAGSPTNAYEPGTADAYPVPQPARKISLVQKAVDLGFKKETVQRVLSACKAKSLQDLVSALQSEEGATKQPTAPQEQDEQRRGSKRVEVEDAPETPSAKRAKRVPLSPLSPRPNIAE